VYRAVFVFVFYLAVTAVPEIKAGKYAEGRSNSRDASKSHNTSSSRNNIGEEKSSSAQKRTTYGVTRR